MRTCSSGPTSGHITPYNSTKRTLNGEMPGDVKDLPLVYKYVDLWALCLHVYCMFSLHCKMSLSPLGRCCDVQGIRGFIFLGSEGSFICRRYVKPIRGKRQKSRHVMWINLACQKFNYSTSSNLGFKMSDRKAGFMDLMLLMSEWQTLKVDLVIDNRLSKPGN